MDFDLHSNNFMLEECMSLDWSFATDSLSEINKIASAESLLLPFPASIQEVDSEVMESYPFAMLPVDNFFVPNYWAPWHHGRGEISPTNTINTNTELPSNAYSVYHPQILELLPLNPVPIATEAMDTGKSTENAAVSTPCINVDEKVVNLAEERVFTVDRIDTGGTGEISPTDTSSTITLPSSANNSAHHPQIHEASPLNPVPIATESIGTGKFAMNEAIFIQCINVDEKVVNLAAERVITMERRDTGKARLAHISYNEIKQYFCMPITQAAKEMKVGLTILKKRCQELGILRWPHRKMKSLRSLIRNVQELGKSPIVGDMMSELEALGRLMEDNPEMRLTERTKKLRQACFKASYKKRRGSANILSTEFLISNQYARNRLILVK